MLLYIHISYMYSIIYILYYICTHIYKRKVYIHIYIMYMLHNIICIKQYIYVSYILIDMI
jgi:hypothetical protein